MVISMICPKCNYAQADVNTECLRCGVIFDKVRGSLADPTIAAVFVGNEESSCHKSASGAVHWLKGHLLEVTTEENRLFIAGRVIVYLLLLAWGLRLMKGGIASNYVGESFMHLVNLPFHEAGHIFFAPFGRFVQVLGGTLGQWLAPFAVFCAFLAKGNPFGAMVGLWWLGESFLDIAPYMDDARAGQLVLLGGVTGSEVADYHDWEVILTELGWLQYDHLIARLSFGIGTFLMILSFSWGGYVLWRQYGIVRQGDT